MVQLTGNNRYRRKEHIDTTQFTARIHTDLFEQLDRLCKSKNVSINFMLNRALRSGIARMV